MEENQAAAPITMFHPNQKSKLSSAKLHPLLFLDFDDVICLNNPYGGFDVAMASKELPDDLWAKLWHAPAVSALLEVININKPRVVVTSSWLQFLDHDGLLKLLEITGLSEIGQSLHPAWEAPQSRGQSRHDAIMQWLNQHHIGEPFVIVDDFLSGTGLADSQFDRDGRVVLCEVNVGFTTINVEKANQALKVSAPIYANGLHHSNLKDANPLATRE